jgi:hypothetical protein
MKKPLGMGWPFYIPSFRSWINPHKLHRYHLGHPLLVANL